MYGLGLVYLTKAVAIFHLGLYYEFDILGQPIANLVFLGLKVCLLLTKKFVNRVTRTSHPT